LNSAVLSELAEGDLAEIWVEIARDHIENADRFIDELRARAQQLAEQPLMGRERSQFGVNVRSFPHDEYLLFYRPTPTGVAIARIVHGRRDLTRIVIPDG